MAIAEKQASNPLLDLLPMLLGQKTTSSQTTSSSANTAPLEQVFANASQPMDPASYDALMAAAFDSAARQIPELTAALANATGTRSSSNSSLALALNEANNRAAQQGIGQVLNYNQGQAQIAGNAAKGIADSTRSQTQSGSQKQGTATNPLAPVIAGWGLNQFDKMGGLKGLSSSVGSVFDGISSFFNPSSDIANSIGSEWNMAPSLGFSGAGGSGGSDFGFSDWGAGVADFAGDVGDTLGGWVDAGTDWIGDIGSGIGDFFGFADGGMTGRAPMAGGWDGSYAAGFCNPRMAPNMRMWNPVARSGGYANGGPVGGGMIPARARAPQQVADAATAGQDPNMVMQMILQQAMMPQPMQAPAPSPMNFLRYLLPMSGFNITQFANGGMPGGRGMGGYADGGVVRNRNNMGPAPTRTGTGAVDASMYSRPSQQTQQSGTSNGSAGGPGGGGVNSDQLVRMVSQISSLLDTGRQTGQMGNPAVSDQRASDIAAMNAADNYASRDKTLAAFASLAAGIAAPAIVGPELASVMSATGLTASPVSALNKAIQAAIEGNASYSQSKAVDASSPVGGAVAVGGPANEGMSVSPDSVDSLGLSPNMSQVVAPSLMGYFGDAGSDAANAGYGDRGPAGSSGDGHDQGEGPGGYNGPSSGGSLGGGGSSSGGGSFGGGTGGMGDANGGLLRGPGTGTSDSIPAKSRVPGEKGTSFSNGEFIMPRDAVEFYGPQFFQDLLMKAHAPVRR